MKHIGIVFGGIVRGERYLRGHRFRISNCNKYDGIVDDEYIDLALSLAQGSGGDLREKLQHGPPFIRGVRPPRPTVWAITDQQITIRLHFYIYHKEGNVWRVWWPFGP